MRSELQQRSGAGPARHGAGRHDLGGRGDGGFPFSPHFGSGRVGAVAGQLRNHRAVLPKLAEIGLTFAQVLHVAFALLSLFFVLTKVRKTKGIELEDMRD